MTYPRNSTKLNGSDTDIESKLCYEVTGWQLGL